MTEANLPSTLLELLKPLQEDYFTQNNLKTIQTLNKQIPPRWGMAAIV